MISRCCTLLNDQTTLDLFVAVVNLDVGICFVPAQEFLPVSCLVLGHQAVDFHPHVIHCTLTLLKKRRGIKDRLQHGSGHKGFSFELLSSGVDG